MRIVLESEREVWLARLEQWYTYGGLLCGLPHQQMNDSMIQRTLEQAAKRAPPGCRSVLIPPKIEVRVHARAKPPRTEERLPPVTCVGVFDSGELQRPGSKMFSSVVVVWFQQEIAGPVPEGVVEEIRGFDWERRATDWSW